MSKKQTALEFYIREIFDILGDDIINILNIEKINQINNLSDKAKEIEKEQVIFSYNQGYRDAEHDSLDIPLSIRDISEFNNAKDYYEETYGE